MTGFTPFLSNGEIAGGIAVTGSVPFLSGMAELKNRLLMIGIFGTGIAALLAIILSVSITRPITKLIQEAKKIGKGITGEPIQIQTKTEIRYLADTMEIMRQNINERENELKAMVGGIAHEIRNPLGAVQLFTDLLGDEMNNTDAENHLRRIKTETGAIKKLVDHFLIYARPPNPCMQNCLLEPIAREAVSGCHDESDKIKVEYDHLKGMSVFADPGMLKQIIVNLAQNAVQAMPEGGRLRIACRKTKTEIHLEIEDTGPGIPEESQKQIFKPFFTTREKGSGLGLAIANNLVRAHKGVIRLVRSDRNGTVFEVILPLKAE
jgi:signal transduction histidine kinase